MKTLQLSPFVLIFLLCLVGGFYWGSQWDNAPIFSAMKNISDEGTFFPAPVSDVEVPRQRNLLLIGVDRENLVVPRLEALWLLIYYPDSTKIDLIPIFPNTDNEDPIRDQVLAASFSITPEGQPGEVFWEQINDRSIRMDHYVLFDRVAVEEIMDVMGLPGLAEEDAFQLAHWESDPAAAISSQTRIFTHLCSAFTDSNVLEDITLFIDHLSPHLITDIPPAQIITDWRLIRSFGARLHCEFPTLTP